MSALPEPSPAAGTHVTASGMAAVAAAGNVAQAFTGDGSVGLYIENVGSLVPHACPPAESVDCPPRLSNLPFRADLFVGRDQQLALLKGALLAAELPVPQVLHGLGGIGKSTLAARWASRHADGCAPVWWITAHSRASIDDGLADLAAALQPSLVTVLPQEQLSEWGRRWLASHSGWLLILDDVTSPADVEPLLARATTGRFLLTSRQSTGWHGIAAEMPLDLLALKEAVKLFHQIRGEQDPDTAELCEELGCLPLAVAQAAAYCRQTQCTVRAYLDDLALHPASMYAETAEGGDHERTVARVWRVTLDRLASDPLTARILLVLAWYAPESVPRDLLGSLGARPAVRGALGRLAAHSMITLSGDSVSVHRLVQAVSRSVDASDPHRRDEAIAQARATATAALAEALPEDVEEPEAWPVMRALLPHVEALAKHVPPEADTAEMTRLLIATGDYMLRVGTRLAPRAAVLLRRAETAAARLHGPESVEVLSARVLTAQVTRMLYDIEQAGAVAERILADCERVLGTEHEVTLRARTNAHRMASLSDDRERSLRLAEEALAGWRRLLGEEAARTFAAREAVAMAVAETGDVVRARSLCGELIEDCVRVLGEEHPQTLSARSAAAMVARQPVLPPAAMDVMAKVFGAAHGDGDLVPLMRDVFEELGAIDLAQVIARATAEEVVAAEQHLEACLRVLDDDHPDTLAARLALLQTYMATRDERYVEPVTRLVMEIFLALGEESPVTGMLLGIFQALQTVVHELPDTPPPPGTMPS